MSVMSHLILFLCYATIFCQAVPAHQTKSLPDAQQAEVKIWTGIRCVTDRETDWKVKKVKRGNENRPRQEWGEKARRDRC